MWIPFLTKRKKRKQEEEIAKLKDEIEREREKELLTGVAFGYKKFVIEVSYPGRDNSCIFRTLPLLANITDVDYTSFPFIISGFSKFYDILCGKVYNSPFVIEKIERLKYKAGRAYFTIIPIDDEIEYWNHNKYYYTYFKESNMSVLDLNSLKLLLQLGDAYDDAKEVEQLKNEIQYTHGEIFFRFKYGV